MKYIKINLQLLIAGLMLASQPRKAELYTWVGVCVGEWSVHCAKCEILGYTKSGKKGKKKTDLLLLI